jgi:DNA repair protein RecN (Recombination protein N)
VQGPTAGRAFINDTSVSVQLLREVGRALVEIHGQHDDRALIDPSGHRDLVDAFGVLSGEAGRVAEAYDAWQRAEAERSRHENDIAASLANAGYLSHALEELRVLNPQAGEEGALASRRQVMMNSEKLAAELAETLDALRGEGTNGARLAAALRRIERQASVARCLANNQASRGSKRRMPLKPGRGGAATAFEPGPGTRRAALRLRARPQAQGRCGTS